MDKSGRRRAILAWGPVLVYMAVIYTLSAQPDLPSPLKFSGADKLGHGIIYLGLALLAYRAAIKSPIAGNPRPYLQALLLTALYGATDEYHQMFVPGRSADVVDWLADILGAVIALTLVAIIRKTYKNGGR